MDVANNDFDETKNTGCRQIVDNFDCRADAVMLSMTDLFSYLLPYPASVLCLYSDPKLNRGSIISIQKLDVLRRHSHMVLQQLLFKLNWERRIKNLMPYVSTGIERLKSIKQQHLLGIKFPNLHDYMTVYLQINSNISTAVKYL